ncbi:MULTISPECIES: DUF2934 domain-containing protein [Nitrosomonas]|uniref:DUF2934 domain-containing protein n=1 Tax=Nitrosomonas communis TaxID=44574 RepID=A0A5D3YH14_9PROT|nr:MULTISPECIES: DUF2934 domain-containing protein [Nitrosomonas]TYP91246.1 Protein of unknown function (DUF2934) [Nitrosomonas communis]UVS61283.1 DUF2934 domain-containing protein [Nitrosomonas sp. PLL12]
MAKQTRTSVKQNSDPNITGQGSYSPEQRETMIREAAYYQYAKRGYASGYELEDWLAAEAEFERRMPESEKLPPNIELQESGTHGRAKDDKLKRMVKQHPHKAIPQVESIEPEEAPAKE